eukprot:CAMPEP_0114445222 /NCGR_PEP_ID=MMETSP0103-20121206/18507_1 /TAXON_ID=37642 ORGANISM="Paraphysomonas imperforata, Strain PA2" /NCGR_SAMPLE_ID=MMETSP0103 /ASSEMBLY_ACC=CAM_ASM_000201 /LENGTH=598 /DNA_ID=CAMNT_0001616817 /DNA_START=228 /DNA_END=2025 /DNA_ORIENTATION=-
MRPVKHFVNSLVMGLPMGFCLQKCFDGGVFSAAVAPIASSVAAPMLSSAVEGRLGGASGAAGPTSPPPFTLLPSRRHDISDAVHAALLATIFSTVVSYAVGFSFSIDALFCAGLVAVTVAVLRLGLDSLLVNIAVYPIDFEKLTPGAFSGEISSAKFQIFHGNYFHAVQNFSLVFLLNNLIENLAIDGISYNDFLESFDCGSVALNQQIIYVQQQQFVDRLYETTELMSTARTPMAYALSHLGAPRPLAATTTDPSRALDSSSSFCDSARYPVRPSLCYIGYRRNSLFPRICRSLALRDLCRLARVSPLRRALIYRNPVLLRQTMQTLCSLVEFHAAQVHLCSAWISADKERKLNSRNPSYCVRTTLISFQKKYFSSFQEQPDYSKSASLEGDPDVGGSKYGSGIGRGEELSTSDNQSGNHATRAMSVVRRLGVMKKRSALISVVSSCLRVLSSVTCLGVSRSPPPLSRREVLDVVNAVDALSTLLVKSLNEDSTGQTCNYFPSSLCAFLNMSTAISTYLDVVNGSSGANASCLKLSRKSKWSPEFECGELQLLLLAVEESVVRVLRTNASVLSTMRSSSSALPIALQAELQRLSSAL